MKKYFVRRKYKPWPEIDSWEVRVRFLLIFSFSVAEFNNAATASLICHEANYGKY